MNLPLTSSTAQQSVLNKRDRLKTITVDVLSGVAEAGCVRASHPKCMPCDILAFDVPMSKSNDCCVCILSALAQSWRWRILLSTLVVLTDFQHPARHRHVPVAAVAGAIGNESCSYSLKTMERESFILNLDSQVRIARFFLHSSCSIVS